MAHLESESVIEPNEEPTGIESLEWLYALEHDCETMASLTDAPVRLLLDHGSGVSTCSPEFATHVKTLTGSSVRARSTTSLVTKNLGKKTVNFDINGIATSVNMETLKISKPIVSRCDVFEISAYMSPNSHGLQKKQVLICPNEIEEAEDPGHAELDESIPEPDVVPKKSVGS